LAPWRCGGVKRIRRQHSLLRSFWTKRRRTKRQELPGEKVASPEKEAWEATGSLITADGSEDEKIAPQGLTATDWPGPPAPGFAIPAEWVPHTVESGGPAGEPEGEEPEAESDTDEESASPGDEEEEEDSEE